MKFDDLDSEMRVYETSADFCVLPGIHMVARLDGRNFTTLTRGSSTDCSEAEGGSPLVKGKFDAPFDTRFRDMMVETVKHLMSCGFKVVYGYTESDEISLLFDLEIDLFGRKTRKYNSVLAGEASARFSLLFKDMAVFDCRICQLPTEKAVVDYFRWRNEDAHRNALNSWCYWTLRKNGKDKAEATSLIEHKTVAEKNELLFTFGINFNDVPNWQKRGVGLYWEKTPKTGYNPKGGTETHIERNTLHIDYDLPMRDEYSGFIRNLLNGGKEQITE